MYLEYFALKENPFSLSPDPKYLFYSKNHKEALAQMIYAAKEDSGFMVLTGEIGTGKTVLINTLIRQFPKSYHFAKIYHSALSPIGLIQNICKEFKLDYADKSMTRLILNIQDFLKWNYNQGGKSLLILDEAQNLSLQTLEEIRLLSNFEAANRKVLQIYLIGQPEFEEKLRYQHIRQLRERVSLKFKLKRLNREETKLYINHRLRVAGIAQKHNLFIDEAINEIYDISNGIPRRINILCDNALILAYSKLYKKINVDIIRQALYNNPMEKYTVPHVPQKAVQPSRVSTQTIQSTATKITTQTMQNTHVVPKQSRIAVANGNGKNGTIDYRKIEHILYQFAERHQMFYLRKPKTRNVILSVLLAFIMFVLAFYLAILLAVEFGLLK